MHVTYGWRCVYNEMCVGGINKVHGKRDSINLINCSNMLKHEDSTEHGKAFEKVGMTPDRDVGYSRKPGLEIDKVLSKNRIDIIGGQKSRELEGSKNFIPGYKWFGKPREGIQGK